MTIAEKLKYRIRKWSREDSESATQDNPWLRQHHLNQLVAYILRETRKQYQNPPAKRTQFNNYANTPSKKDR